MISCPMRIFTLSKIQSIFDGDPVDVAVVPSGTVRDTYTKGNLTVEDIFNSFSLGIGKRRCTRISAD